MLIDSDTSDSSDHTEDDIDIEKVKRGLRKVEKKHFEYFRDQFKLVYDIDESSIDFYYKRNLKLYTDNLFRFFELYHEQNSENYHGICFDYWKKSVLVEKNEFDQRLKIQILPIFEHTTSIIGLNKSFIYFESATGSGKTTSLPIILIMKFMLDSDTIKKIVILILPKLAHVKNFFKIFNESYQNNILISSNTDDVFKWYCEELEKPGLAILTHRQLIELVSMVKAHELPFYKYTRFIFDESHERNIYFDISFTIIRKEIIHRNKIPLQLIQMSATPDSRLMSGFDHLFIDKSFLYDVIDKPVEVDSIKEIENAMINEVINLTKVEQNEGHILCFLEGINSCQKVIDGIKEKTPRNCSFVSEIKNDEKIEDYFERIYFSTQNIEFDKFFIPIVLTGSVSESAKELAFSSLPAYMNQFSKIICSTNLVESSFTICDLYAVVDSGMYKFPIYDPITLITRLKTGFISESMRNQRRGRVGRTKDGVFIRILVKNNPLPKSIVPDFLRNCMESTFLTLFQYGFDVLDFSRDLPIPPSEKEITSAISNLKKLSLIDKDRQISEKGKMVVKFPLLDPFLSSIILNEKKGMNSNERFFEQILESLIAIIIMEIKQDLFIDLYTDKLLELFCPYSDIVTIVNALIYILDGNMTEENDRCKNVGIPLNWYLQTKNDLIQIIHYLDPRINDNRIDSLIIDFAKRFNSKVMYEYVDSFINRLIVTRESHYSSKKAQLCGMIHTDNTISAVYKTKSFLNLGLKEIEITIHNRPGWNKCTVPGEIMVFSLSLVEETKKAKGFCIHTSNLNSTNNIVSIKVSPVMNNHFALGLLHVFFGGKSNYPLCFYQKKEEIGAQSGERFCISELRNTCFLSFSGSFSGNFQEIIHACQMIQLIIPYVPRSVLVFRSELATLFEIITEKSNHRVMIHDTSSIANVFYELSKDLILFLSSNIKLLQDNTMRFSLLCNILLEKELQSSYYSENISFDDCNPILLGSKQTRLIVIASNQIQHKSFKILNLKANPPSPFDCSLTIKRINQLLPGIIESSYDRDIYITKLDNVNYVLLKSNNQNEYISSITPTIERISKEMLTNIGKLSFENYSLKTACREKINLEVQQEYITNAIHNDLNLNCRVKFLGNYGWQIFVQKSETNYSKEISQVLQKIGLKCTIVEKFRLINIKLYHRSNLEIDKESLEREVISQSNMFGFMSVRKIHYDESKTPDSIGSIMVEIIEPEAAITFVKRLSKQICRENYVIINPPDNLKPLMEFKTTREAIFKQINRLIPSVQLMGSQIMCIENKSKELSVFLASQSIGNYGFSVIRLEKICLSVCMKSISRQNRNYPGSSYFDKKNRAILVKSEYFEQFKTLFESINPPRPSEVFGCINDCENSKLSLRMLSIEDEKRRIISNHLCLDCYVDHFDASFGNYIEKNTFLVKKILKEKPTIPSLILSPDSIVPIGQIVWILYTEPSTSQYVKWWMEMVVSHTIEFYKNYFTACPIHSDLIIRTPAPPNNFRCPHPGCTMIYCYVCRIWHGIDFKNCKDIYHGKRCPRCQIPTEKNDGCDHMTCRCGAHWCYICGAESTASNIYPHIRSHNTR